ncbi:uncharacterized protein LOC129833034 [Salvelinus fontinalis]|uniref:uncharacterized protein LOC129833034 n=1 Tax=Salvelinus fontinalis TaxID=8038 RepID=UPI0024859643|nr:uncharacterized protein LOC129833034 [Salvelinus fontinalis]
MERKALLCIFFLLLPLALVSADIPVLNSINDLRNIEFGHRFPRHGLMLLHFISGGLYVDNNDALIPTFSPEMGDWGFHEFYNNEGVFPPLQDQNRQGYYAVGNINTPTAYPLYPYVTLSYYLTPGNLERNMDRLVVRTSPNSRRLEAVYITQHIRGSSEYDPYNTYQTSPALLREIRTLSQNRVDSVEVFLYAAGYNVDSRTFTWNCYATDSTYTVEDAGRMTLNESPAMMKGAVVNDHHTECYAVVLQVKSTESGYARLGWANVPDSLLDVGVMLALFNKDGNHLLSLSLDMRSYGTYDTNQYLNHGLQVKLLSKDGSNVIMSGPQYDDADRKIPVGIEGYDASLQLYTKDGNACARLFISKTFTDWKNDFYYSWVGFYSNHNDASYSYYTHEYAVSFTKQDDTNIKYDIYSYVSSLSIQPGAQARFFFTKTYNNILAKTKPWER